MKFLYPLMLLACSSLAQATTTNLTFDVFLGNDPIGFHRVSIEDLPDGRRVRVEAAMKVRFLFFTAFRYHHVADERWRDDCILALETRTNNDGDRLQVAAEPLTDALEIDTGKERTRLEGCVRTFAYWAPDLLDSEFLLNTQNGNYEPVRLTELAPGPFEFNGRLYGARHYRLDVGDKASIDLWYGEDDSWQALRTTVADGRVLNYVRREG